MQQIWIAQLHQLREELQGKKQGTCILLYKESLSKNSIKRIKILKESDDGFFIAEGSKNARIGDLTGFQQSGVKNFRFADPVIHDDLFKPAENFVIKIRDQINKKIFISFKTF